MAEALKPINGGAFQLYPYNAHKRWNVTNINYRNDSYLVSVLKGISPLYNQLTFDSTELDNSNSNSTSFLKTKDQKTIWSGVNQMFYKHRAGMERHLYASASIFSIPHNRLGDGIKPESVTIVDNSITSSHTPEINISDVQLNEYHGHLYDSDLDTTSYVPTSDLVGYWGFNNEVVPKTISVDNNIEDRSGYNNPAYGRNLTYDGGIRTSGHQQLPSGTKVTFNGTDSYIKVDHNKELEFFKGEDYSISVWTVLPTSQSDTTYDYNWVMNKNSTYKDYGQNTKLNGVLRKRNVSNPIFPFDLKVYNQNTSDNGKVVATLSDGLTNIEVTSTTRINDASEHHIVFNKIGSALTLWIDGVLDGEANINLKSQIANSNDVVMGSRFLSDGWAGDSVSGYGSLSGSIDEVRIYRKSLTESQIQGLANNHYVSSSAYQTNVVGEVFYKHGVMVISDPRPLYRHVLLSENGDWDYGNDFGWNVQYRSTKRLDEVSVLCEIGADEFNVSQNPSLRKNQDPKSEFLQGFVTGSDFNTYYTTIGLYNPEGDLIAVGKLGSAIKNRDDVDITVKVRLDLDGVFGKPSVGNLEPIGRTATISKTEDGKFIWNRRGIPDIGVK